MDWNQYLVDLSPAITNLCIAVFTLIFGILGRYVAKLINKKNELLDAKLNEAQRQFLSIIAKEAFALAETEFKNYGGPEKFERAKDYFITRLEKLGIDISDADIKALIEKAVLEYNSNVKPTPKVVGVVSDNQDQYL
ncbi:Phage holin protein [compost metagenome]